METIIYLRRDVLMCFTIKIKEEQLLETKENTLKHMKQEWLDLLIKEFFLIKKVLYNVKAHHMSASCTILYL